MKKIIPVILIVAVVLILWIAARATHTFETFSSSSTSNEPTYQPGHVIMASRFKKPDYGTFVCFKQPNGAIWVFRCIAKGGDMIEIKDAKVYLNGKLLDEPYVYNESNITARQLDSIRGYVERNKNPTHLLSDSLNVISLTDSQLKEYHLNLKPHISPKGLSNIDMYGDFKFLKYSEDNLGPVKVPENSYFLLGDNRHDAMDSRFLGFINKDDIVSTVIN